MGQGVSVTEQSGPGAIFDAFRARFVAPNFRDYDVTIVSRGIDGATLFGLRSSDNIDSEIKNFLTAFGVNDADIYVIRPAIKSLIGTSASGPSLPSPAITVAVAPPVVDATPDVQEALQIQVGGAEEGGGRKKIPKRVIVFHDGENCTLPAKPYIRDAQNKIVMARAAPGMDLRPSFHRSFPQGYGEIRFNDVFRHVVQTACTPRLGHDLALQVDEFSDVSVTYHFVCPVSTPPNLHHPSYVTRNAISMRAVDARLVGKAGPRGLGERSAVDNKIKELWQAELDTVKDFSKLEKDSTVFVLVAGDFDFHAEVRRARKAGIEVVLIHSTDSILNPNYIGLANTIFPTWTDIVDKSSRALIADAPQEALGGDLDDVRPGGDIKQAVEKKAVPLGIPLGILQAKYVNTKGYGFEKLQEILSAINPLLAAEIIFPAQDSGNTKCYAKLVWQLDDSEAGGGAGGGGASAFQPGPFPEEATEALSSFLKRIVLDDFLTVSGYSNSDLKNDVEIQAVAKQSKVWLVIPKQGGGGGENNKEDFVSKKIHEAGSEGILEAKLGSMYIKEYSSKLKDDCGEFLKSRLNSGLFGRNEASPYTWVCRCRSCKSGGAGRVAVESVAKPLVVSDNCHLIHPVDWVRNDVLRYCSKTVVVTMNDVIHLRADTSVLGMCGPGMTATKVAILTDPRLSPENKESLIVKLLAKCRNHRDDKFPDLRFITPTSAAARGGAGGGYKAGFQAGGGAGGDAVPGILEGKVRFIYLDEDADKVAQLRTLIMSRSNVKHKITISGPSSKILLVKSRLQDLLPQLRSGGQSRVNLKFPLIKDNEVTTADGYEAQITFSGKNDAVENARKIFEDFIAKITVVAIQVPLNKASSPGMYVGYLRAKAEFEGKDCEAAGSDDSDAASTDASTVQSSDQSSDSDKDEPQQLVISIDRVKGKNHFKLVVTFAHLASADETEVEDLRRNLQTLHEQFAEEAVKLDGVSVRDTLRRMSPFALKEQLISKFGLYFCKIDNTVLRKIDLCGSKDDVDAAKEWLKNEPAADQWVHAKIGHSDLRVIKLFRLKANEELKKELQAKLQTAYPGNRLAQRTDNFFCTLSGPARLIDQVKEGAESMVAKFAQEKFHEEPLLTKLTVQQAQFLACAEAKVDLEKIASSEGALIGGKSGHRPIQQHQQLRPWRELLRGSIGALELRVLQGNALKLGYDALVNPANSMMDHAGGIARLIRDAAGDELDRECAQKVSLHRAGVAVGESIVTGAYLLGGDGSSGNNLKTIIHTVGPTYRLAREPHVRDEYKKAVKSALRAAEGTVGVDYLALPLMGSGIYGWNQDLAASLLLEAIVEWVEGGGSLKRVALIDNDESKAASIVAAVQHLASAPRRAPAPAPAPAAPAAARPPAAPRRRIKNHRVEFLYYWKEDDGSWVPYDYDQQLEIEHWAQGGASEPLHLLGDRNLIPSVSKNVLPGQKYARYFMHRETTTHGVVSFFQRNEASTFRRSVKRMPFKADNAPLPPGFREFIDDSGDEDDNAPLKAPVLPKPSPRTASSPRPSVPVIITTAGGGSAAVAGGGFGGNDGLPPLKLNSETQAQARAIKVFGTSAAIGSARARTQKYLGDSRNQSEIVDLSESSKLPSMTWDAIKDSLGVKVRDDPQLQGWDVVDKGNMCVQLEGLGKSFKRQATYILTDFKKDIALLALKQDAHIELPEYWPQEGDEHAWLQDFYTELLDPPPPGHPPGTVPVCKERRSRAVWAPDVVRGSPEWVWVEDEWRGTPARPGCPAQNGEPAEPDQVRGGRNRFTNPIVRIQRIQNPRLWGSFYNKARILAKIGPDKDDASKTMWEKAKLTWQKHGSSSMDPFVIAADKDGLDMRFCEKGMLGKGVYVGEDASYSDSYAYKTATGEKQMFLCMVVPGRIQKRVPKPDKTCQKIIRPDHGFDSVRGDVNTLAIVLYDNHQCYPSYIITYK